MRCTCSALHIYWRRLCRTGNWHIPCAPNVFAHIHLRPFLSLSLAREADRNRGARRRVTQVKNQFKIHREREHSCSNALCANNIACVHHRKISRIESLLGFRLGTLMCGPNGHTQEREKKPKLFHVCQKTKERFLLVRTHWIVCYALTSYCIVLPYHIVAWCSVLQNNTFIFRSVRLGRTSWNSSIMRKLVLYIPWLENMRIYFSCETRGDARKRPRYSMWIKKFKNKWMKGAIALVWDWSRFQHTFYTFPQKVKLFFLVLLAKNI